MPREKVKFAMRIKPETQELVREWYPKDNCQSQNEFIEKAIHFYVEHLAAQESTRFLPSALVAALRATVQGSENRIARLLFKLTVEISWQALLVRQVPEMAKAMKIPLDQFRWYAAFHDEGHHPHIHMVCYSVDGKSGFLTKQGIADIKSMLAKEIFQQDLIAIYQRQTQRRDELTEAAEEVMRRLVSEMQTGTLGNQRIELLMLELAKRLQNCSGKKQYGYLPPAVKSIVNEIVDELEKDPRITAAYDLWYEQREEVLGTYKDDLPERIPLLEDMSLVVTSCVIVNFGDGAFVTEYREMAGGGAVYFLKFKKKKPDTKGSADLDDYDYGNEDGEAGDELDAGEDE